MEVPPLRVFMNRSYTVIIGIQCLESMEKQSLILELISATPRVHPLRFGFTADQSFCERTYI
jgi:hypothetical protein